MKYFLLLLILIIVGLCGGGYYEYTILQQKNDDDGKKISDLNAQIDSLQTEGKKLSDDKAQLTKSLSDDEDKISVLTKQQQETQGDLTTAKGQVDQLQKDVAKAQAAADAATAAEAAEAAAVAAGHANPNDLGTVTLLDGKIYKNCQLVKVDTDGIVVNYSDSVTKLYFNLMPPDLQKKFGYDPHQPVVPVTGN